MSHVVLLSDSIKLAVFPPPIYSWLDAEVNTITSTCSWQSPYSGHNLNPKHGEAVPNSRGWPSLRPGNKAIA